MLVFNAINLFKLLVFSILMVNFNKTIMDTHPNNWKDKLVKIYDYVCQKFEESLRYDCLRYSNNSNPEFTDQEIMTIYLFVMHHQRLFNTKDIHRYTKDHLMSWFPNLNSYQAFNNRLNNLCAVIRKLAEQLIDEFKPIDCSDTQSLLDSMPIILCSGKRQARVATEITDKGYCSTKGMYYYGVKLHALGFRRDGKLPYPEQIIISKASENDLTIYKENWSELENRTFFGDKIYQNEEFFKAVKLNYKSEMLTPIKYSKGVPDAIKKFNKAADELYSKAVSTIRQPIEGFFNWLIQKSDIQNASKVRSTKGLSLHLGGRLAAAFIGLIF